MAAQHGGVPAGATLPSLMRWGLSSDADLIYRVLATTGARDVRALGAELGMPGRRVHDAMAELCAAGAVRSCGPAPGYRSTWAPRPPVDLVAHLRRHRPPGRGPTGPELSAREVELVMLLAGGHTDAGAAARLRISPRSVTTIVRGLMDRFGVDNRFQLGLALGATRRIPAPGKRTAPER